MLQYEPQPVFRVYPGNLLNIQNMGGQNQTQEGYDLEVLAHTPITTPIQQYFDVASGQDELDMWRRDANGPRRASENGPQSMYPA
jgi:hypothetical protein